jgi:ribonuclease HI
MEHNNNEENNVVKNTTLDPNEKQPLKFILYSDGGSRGNPGPSACGFIIENMDGETIFEGGEYLGVTTNNQAEYHGLRMALEKALELGAEEIEFRGDSQLVVNQLNGVYKVKNKDLWPIYERIRELRKKFKRATFNYVPRELNTHADAMVNKILDEHERTSRE